jgi:glycerol-3-phosphate responsive antiterminator
LNGLRFLEFSWDPNCPRPIDHLDELLELSLTTPLQTRCTLSDLKKYIEQMRQGRIAVMVNVDTLEEAKEAVRLVRKHSVI